jgi:transcriptional regulator GlxA family with amidase domain
MSRTGSETALYGIPAGPANRPVSFYLEPTFGMLAFISAVEALRVANRLSEQNLYSWRVITRDGQPVPAANGMLQEADASIEQVKSAPLLFVLGHHDPHRHQDRKVLNWLRDLDRRGSVLGGLDTGAYVLAQAGLLTRYRSTIHWENRTGMLEAFPELVVSNRLFEIDGPRLTCAGGTAALDLMLHLIERQQGRELATAVAEMFMHVSLRAASEPQRMSLESRTGVCQPKVLDGIALMEANVEQPLTVTEISEAIGITKRQLERLFRAYLDTTPSRYYMEVRLCHGRRLLEQTALSITDVALASGFVSPGHFSRCYRGRFGHPPRQTRISRGRNPVAAS